MTGAPEGSPKVVLCVFFFMVFFMEKPGIEPATPGLQGIALIHYTTGLLLTGLLKFYLESMICNGWIYTASLTNNYIKKSHNFQEL